MAPRRIEMLLRLCLVMALWGGTLAQSQSSCTNVFISLAPCLDYVTGNVSNPSSSCCSQLAYVVSSQPLCLCEVVSGAASTIAASFNINQTRALALPTSCNIQTPPLTTCTGNTSSHFSIRILHISQNLTFLLSHHFRLTSLFRFKLSQLPFRFHTHTFPDAFLVIFFNQITTDLIFQHQIWMQYRIQSLFLFLSVSFFLLLWQWIWQSAFFAQGLDPTLFHQRPEVVHLSVVHLTKIQVPLLNYHVLGFWCLSLQPLWLSPSRVPHRSTFFKPSHYISFTASSLPTYIILQCLLCLNKVRISLTSVLLIISIFLPQLGFLLFIRKIAMYILLSKWISKLYHLQNHAIINMYSLSKFKTNLNKCSKINLHIINHILIK